VTSHIVSRIATEKSNWIHRNNSYYIQSHCDC